MVTPLPVAWRSVTIKDLLLIRVPVRYSLMTWLVEKETELIVSMEVDVECTEAVAIGCGELVAWEELSAVEL